MNVDYELLQRGCLTAREIRLKQQRIREATPERKAQHKRAADLARDSKAHFATRRKAGH